MRIETAQNTDPSCFLDFIHLQLHRLPNPPTRHQIFIQRIQGECWTKRSSSSLEYQGKVGQLLPHFKRHSNGSSESDYRFIRNTSKTRWQRGCAFSSSQMDSWRTQCIEIKLQWIDMNEKGGITYAVVLLDVDASFCCCCCCFCWCRISLSFDLRLLMAAFLSSCLCH